MQAQVPGQIVPGMPGMNSAMYGQAQQQPGSPMTGAPMTGSPMNGSPMAGSPMVNMLPTMNGMPQPMLNLNQNGIPNQMPLLNMPQFLSQQGLPTGLPGAQMLPAQNAAMSPTGVGSPMAMPEMNQMMKQDPTMPVQAFPVTAQQQQVQSPAAQVFPGFYGGSPTNNQQKMFFPQQVHNMPSGFSGSSQPPPQLLSPQSNNSIFINQPTLNAARGTQLPP